MNNEIEYRRNKIIDFFDYVIYRRGYLGLRYWIITKKHIRLLRNKIEKSYFGNPTGCGGSFGELLCYEIHEGNLTFVELAKKWKISVSTIGELIYDHCRKMEKF